MSRWLPFLGFSVLVILGCDRFNSEFRIPGARPWPSKPATDEKILCDFKVEDNCWQETLDYVHQCMADSLATGADRFYDNRQLCGNNNEKLIKFDSPQSIELDQQKAYDGPLKVAIYSRGNTCLQMSGMTNNFTLTTDFGDLLYLASADGAASIRCADGRFFQLSRQKLRVNCGFTEAEVEKIFPRLEFTYFEEQEKQGWQLSLAGRRDDLLNLFRCEL